MTTQPEDLRSERVTSTGGGDQHPDVPDPAVGAAEPARPITTREPTDAAAIPELAESGASGAPAAALPTADAADSVVTGEPVGSVSGAVATAEAGAAPERVRPRRRRRWFRYTLPGAAGALLFTCLAFTPSLLPRGPVVQGLVCGIYAAIGYGLGVVAAWVWRAFADRDARPARSNAWRVFAAVAGVALVAAFVLGQHWQSADARPDGGDRQQRRARVAGARSWPRSCSSPWSRSAAGCARSTAGWPGCSAAGSDRAAAARRRLGRWSSASPRAGQRRAARRPGVRRRRGVLGPNGITPGGRAPAH